MTDQLEKWDTIGNNLWLRSDIGQYDMSPLPSVFRKGLIAIILIASLSVLTTFALLIFVAYRLIFSRSHSSRYVGYNQYIILIYQLILADLQHSLGYLISVKWLVEDKITADSWTCFVQGMWLQLANPGSGLFVLAIAIHTCLAVTMNRKLSYRAFVAFIISIWVFLVALVIIPIAMHGREAIVPSGPWCWINSKYEPLRLYTHYLWIFVAEFGSASLYAIVAFQLRQIITQSAILENRRTETGRMAMMQGITPSPAYFCAAAAIITSSGVVDVTIYTLTRRNLITNSEPGYDHSRDRFGISTSRKHAHHLATITAEPKTNRAGISRLRSRSHKVTQAGGSSTDNIAHDVSEDSPGLAQTYKLTTFEVTSERVHLSQAEASRRMSRDSERSTPAMPPTAKLWGW
ncbi:uncharacterized protein N7446_010496 [Penicillium canescens]|uniref:uncharacterized protein n=1 Tax=Penicillium canescens TaxID=5083 RepID=UPI0026DF81BB|nr:uncharacterized protein N7446_010496 [Penicillium canescens]KAJ6050387.1 hypothetical protein N7446_010496 [Penicillium canescens]